MTGRIFINYRRDDAGGTAGRLYDRLAGKFGRKTLFMDVGHIPAGVDFATHLKNQVAGCDVFLAVIGPNWLDARSATGGRRLDDPGDYVAAELAAALARDIPVIPVLVDGARLPTADALPEPLKPLAGRHAVEVRNTQFDRDADALVREVGAALKDTPVWARPLPLAAAAALALLLAGGLGLYQMGILGRSDSAQPKRAATEQATGPRTEAPARPADWAEREASCHADAPQPMKPAARPFTPMAGAFEQGRWRRRAGTGSCRFIAGKLQLNTHGGSILVAANDTMIQQDFTYSVTADVVSGSTDLAFGLVFGLEGTDDYVLFAKRTNREYRLTQWRGGAEQVVLPWTKSDLISDVRRPQTLQVVTEDRFITLLVDGQKLQQVRLDGAPAGSVGLFAEVGGLTVSFSDVHFGPRR
jgi:TIR domain-containing protein